MFNHAVADTPQAHSSLAKPDSSSSQS